MRLVHSGCREELMHVVQTEARYGIQLLLLWGVWINLEVFWDIVRGTSEPTNIFRLQTMTAVTVTYPHSAREEIYWIHHYHIVACFFSGNSLSAIDFPKNCLFGLHCLRITSVWIMIFIVLGRFKNIVPTTKWMLKQVQVYVTLNPNKYKTKARIRRGCDCRIIAMRWMQMH